MNLKLSYRILLLAVISLMIIGSAEVLSASSIISYLKYESFYHLFTSHLIKIFIAIGALILFSFIPYEIYKKYSKKLIVGIVVLLFITLFVAHSTKGAGRWINLYAFSFQPSEIAKLVLLIHLAYLIEEKGKDLKNFNKGFLFPLVWIISIAFLIILQPNVSVSIMIVIVSFAILFVGGAKLTHLVFSLGTIGSLAGFAMWSMPHSNKRLASFLDSFGNGGHINTQVFQAKVALGSGWWYGIGLGQSRQSDLFLPEAYGDFIFSIVGEELGFIGAAVILFIYLTIFIIGVIVAKNAKDQFGQLLAFGISFTIILSAFINAAVVTGIIPTTGIPLPFISYGGTSIIFTCAAMGIIVNIAMQAYKAKRIKAEIKK
ncbi:MAG: putative peptidoglycan glycosyltransferase FtsW [Ignavibacteriales bacterium]|nr:putative peptidoglycan glycosyltransferase FtsW [Ignavibacteriales bacterium]